jgi:hypothetical protein
MVLPANVTAPRGDQKYQTGEQVAAVPAQRFLEWF